MKFRLRRDGHLVIVFLIPLAALLLAMTWVRWARRPAKPLDPMSQVEAYQRAVSALARYDQAQARQRDRQSAE